MKITAAACKSREKTSAQQAFNAQEYLKLPDYLAKEFVENCARARELTINVPADSPDLRHIPDNFRQEFLNSAGTEFVFPLTMRAGHYMMYYCPNRQLRQQWYEAYMSPDRPGKNCDNRPVAQHLARTYGEDAARHDYQDFYSGLLKNKMIKDPQVIEELLAQLRPQIATQYRKMYEQFAKSASAAHKFKKFAPWDVHYAIIRSARGVPQGVPGEFEQYFELNRVKKFLFAYIEQLFELRFIPQSDSAAEENYWIYDCRAEKFLAAMDFAPSAALTQKQSVGQVCIVRPATIASNNLTKVTVSCALGHPAFAPEVLLTTDQLRALFHEMGHVIEGVFTAEQCAKTAWEKPESDTEEFYSMFMENLVFDQEFLQAMSAHYKTGQKIPRAVIAPRLAREEYFDALTTARWWEISQKEREIHRWPPHHDLSAQLEQVEETIYGPNRSWRPNMYYETLPGLFCAEPSQEHYVGTGHTYLLGRLLARAVFKKFKANKSVFRSGVGKRLRDEIYTQRPFRSFFDSYCAYTGESEIKLDLEEISRLRLRPSGRSANRASRSER